MEIVKKLFSQINLDLGDMESEYRRENLDVDIAQEVVLAIGVALAVLGMLFLDFLWFKGNPALLSWMVWYRLGFGLFTLIIVLALLNAHSPKNSDRIVFVWLLVSAIYLILINFTRSSNYLLTPFGILLPFGIYLLSPLHLKYNFALAVSYSIGTILVDSVYKTGVPSIALSVAISSQILVHLIGLPAALQIQSYRRRFFKAHLDQKDAREMANYLINIDALTKCMTRPYFMKQSETEFARARRLKLPLSLLMMDLDHFKKINDKYGHHMGDLALQRFGEVVLVQKRAQDIFGRLGGEEFGLLLKGTNLKNARLVADRIQKAWANTIISEDEKTVRSTVSIGVVEMSAADRRFDGLLRRGDAIMYKAKRSGRNRVAIK